MQRAYTSISMVEKEAKGEMSCVQQVYETLCLTEEQ